MTSLLTVCSTPSLYSSTSSTASYLIFFFNDTAPTEIYTLSLHDALPISAGHETDPVILTGAQLGTWSVPRSEEHTSELQSLTNLVCRLLLEKKKERQIGALPKVVVGRFSGRNVAAVV